MGKVVHGALDGLGFIPAAGAIPDGINAGIYALEGDKKNAAISAGAAVPLVGDIGKGGKILADGTKAVAKHGDEAAKAGAKTADEVVAAPPTRNGHLAGGTHPETGVPFKENGFPDFSAHSKESVTVDGLTGNQKRDVMLVNREAGLTKTPPNYVWHHVEDGRTMQLVPKELHERTGHTGGAALLRRGEVPEGP